MQFIKVLLLAFVTLCNVVEVTSKRQRPFGCHTRKDKNGKPCVLHGATFMDSASDFCHTFFGIKNNEGTYIPTGQSISAKMPHVPDGKGDEQTFWGG
ncbi:hypothetical protein ACMFMG_010220 [Clarireedia jacksonii]